MKDPKDPRHKSTLPLWQKYITQGVLDSNNDGKTNPEEFATELVSDAKSAWSNLKSGNTWSNIKSGIATMADGSMQGPAGNQPDGETTPAEYAMLAASFIGPGGLAKGGMRSLLSKGKNFGSKFSKIFEKRNSNTLLKKTDYLDPSGGGLIAKGGYINTKEVDIATKNMGFSTTTPYLHGSSSASLPNVSKQGLRPNSSSSVSMGGESSYLGTPNHINIDHVSASAVTDAGTSINYAMNMSGRKDYAKAYNTLIDKGKLKMTLNQRAQHVELQKQASNRLENWAGQTSLNKKLMTENYPVVYGINPNVTSKLGSGRFNTRFKSDMGSEVAIRKGVNLNEISSVSVPKWKMNEVKKMFPKTEIKDINKVFINSPDQTRSLKNNYYQKNNKLQFEKLLNSFKGK
tara:strand:+ start:56 stop:1261 length:1206 start_codon:yes stop_codon:yes gene_type:complete